MSGLTSIEREGRLKRAELYRARADEWALDLKRNEDGSVDTLIVEDASRAVLALCALAQLEIELAREGWRTNR